MYLTLLFLVLLILFICRRQTEGFCNCQGEAQPCNCANCPYRKLLQENSQVGGNFSGCSCKNLPKPWTSILE